MRKPNSPSHKNQTPTNTNPMYRKRVYGGDSVLLPERLGYKPFAPSASVSGTDFSRMLSAYGL